jgi:carboxypeptidase-like protein
MRIEMRAILLAFALMFAAVPAMAQASNAPGCNGTAGGTIRGLTRDDSTWEMIPHQVMIITDLNCRTETNMDGIFQFDHVPAGTHTLRTSSIYAYRRKTINVKVTDDSVSNVEFQLLPANSVDDCLEITACAAILRPDSASVADLTEDERIHEVGTRTVIAMQQLNPDMVICVADASPGIVKAIAKRVPGAVSYGECALNDTTSTSIKRHMIHKPDGRDAGVFYGGQVTMVDANTFNDRAMFYSNPLLISWWNCQFAKLSRMWIPVSCRPEVR